MRNGRRPRERIATAAEDLTFLSSDDVVSNGKQQSTGPSVAWIKGTDPSSPGFMLAAFTQNGVVAWSRSDDYFFSSATWGAHRADEGAGWPTPSNYGFDYPDSCMTNPYFYNTADSAVWTGLSEVAANRRHLGPDDLAG
ncbi:MAG TPA: hypothetical protein VHB21_10995 [Minicystis sp.]|nr:hypothetical protein [Minicystis sp.]